MGGDLNVRVMMCQVGQYPGNVVQNSALCRLAAPLCRRR